MTSESPSWRLTAARYTLITLVALLLVAVYRRVLHVNQTTVALTFLVLIMLVATRWRLAYSVYLSALCTVLYNFFFLPPIGTLTIADPQNWVTLVAFLMASVLVSHLADGERKAAAQSERRRGEVERLFEFSEQLLLYDDLRALARTAPSLIATIFKLRAVALYIREQDRAYYSDPENELLPAERLRAVAEETDAAALSSNHVRLLPLALGMQSSGALAMTESSYPEGMYAAIAGLMAIALERASALERFSHIEASREGERLRGALLDSVTHELRTPLTAIRAAATMLLSQPSLADADRQEMYAIVDEESSRLDRLIGQAVEMAQLDSESLQVRPQPQQLREVIDLALEDIRQLLKNRSVEVLVPDDQPAVSMDRELVRRVLRQLIENAAKYSPRDLPITLSSKLTEDRLLVTVSDRGPGIDESDQPFVFDKFFRGKQRERVQGSGMGLAIARAILRAHGGGIDVKSSPQSGTSFTFWLPLTIQPASMET
ncbi:Osmosensitive K+ channel histidine kinase KdpD [Acidisarcina polymorpha]|uniref:histidine kinase n=1 Tax=Acidisarcina polymorpha TaxID=2211140 RepID=A0A2Z5G7C0_9BACT|nr:ATP-binding protein [Acidisarcina polymorpha]AXC15163.1 Osmosensitive K+ channel histidine kinase KdpD [Acidisarcina polymorpha]